MPEDEDSLALEGVFSFDDMLREVLSFVRNFRPHIVDEERFREVVFVVGVGHRLEVQGHGGTALDITDLVATGRRVAVNVEKFGNLLAVLREERVAAILLPLLIVIHHVVSLRSEKFAQLLIGKHLVENVNLIDSRFCTLVSDASSSDQSCGKEVNFPQWGVREHQEGEARVGNKTTGPHVV